MERLTAHSKYSGTPTPNLKTIGDVCMKMPFCDDYDACKGCAIRKIIDRLCEYEDTGLTPEEIVELKEKKNTAKVRRCEGARRLTITKVGRNGVLINGQYYFSEKLMIKHYENTVEIYTNLQLKKAYVYYRGELIEEFHLQ